MTMYLDSAIYNYENSRLMFELLYFLMKCLELLTHQLNRRSNKINAEALLWICHYCTLKNQIIGENSRFVLTIFDSRASPLLALLSR